MTTYEKWRTKFNEGGNESFEEFICNALDTLYEALTVDIDPDAVPPTDPNAGSPQNT